MATPATSVQGLAAKAKCAKFAAPELWDEDEDEMEEWHLVILRRTIDAVIEFASTQAAVTAT